MYFSSNILHIRPDLLPREMIAFQANTSEMPPVCKYVPVIVDDDVSMITKGSKKKYGQTTKRCGEIEKVQLNKIYSLYKTLNKKD